MMNELRNALSSRQDEELKQEADQRGMTVEELKAIKEKEFEEKGNVIHIFFLPSQHQVLGSILLLSPGYLKLFVLFRNTAYFCLIRETQTCNYAPFTCLHSSAAGPLE